jgi:hypothetical protein
VQAPLSAQTSELSEGEKMPSRRIPWRFHVEKSRFESHRTHGTRGVVRIRSILRDPQGK